MFFFQHKEFSEKQFNRVVPDVAAYIFIALIFGNLMPFVGQLSDLFCSLTLLFGFTAILLLLTCHK